MKIKKPDYYSPSTINLFVRDKAKFIMKLANIDSFEGNSATIRGEAVEFALARKLAFDTNYKDTLNNVVNHFHSSHFGSRIPKDEKYEKEKSSLKGYLDQILPTYNMIEDEFIGTQTKISLELKDVSVPLLGYVDFEFNNHIRDLKTTKSIPSNVPHSIKRQLAIYSKATGKEAWVDFVSPKKTTSIKIDNVEDTISEVTAICKGIDKLLSISDDARELSNIFYPNLDSWEWDQETINNAKQLWSVK
jgi:hypothetical protein|tara:strand:- start:435 stop:1175 length:741 start_codon:yes stop_codon:yes gene_type:complete